MLYTRTNKKPNSDKTYIHWLNRKVKYPFPDISEPVIATTRWRKPGGFTTAKAVPAAMQRIPGKCYSSF
ncbi:hypothetical protein A9B99_14315 [Mangrovibacter phragmitis]|uniref:Uncharacterized protein n=1 Tax=Mangrovibacter phragmitis TaxID=1691903 RepID=A0A1B7KZK0_9ENTR|nr:hypothetical protein A9B99_14315 [Mangrovibacter phragmitis]